MAGDWIKFECATLDKPEVHVIAAILNIDPDAVVGKLLRIWTWFDAHSQNGDAPETLRCLLERLVNEEGFIDAMQQCGWIEIKKGRMYLPNFTRHNGQSAKKRVLKNERQSKWRRKNVDANVDNGASRETSTREEKRREDINTGESSKRRVDTKGPVPSADFESLSLEKSRQGKINATELNAIHRNAYRAMFAETMDAEAVRENADPLRRTVVTSSRGDH